MKNIEQKMDKISKKLMSAILLVEMLLVACTNGESEFDQSSNVISSSSLINETEMATTFASGKGTISDPYMINTPEEFKYFREQVNLGNDFINQYIVLNTNLNVTESIWQPIGSRSRKFMGNFDGNGKTISGVLKATYDVEVFGFFGYIVYGTISNLNITATIDASNVAPEATSYIGSVAGRCDGTMVNCSNKGLVQGPKAASRSVRIGGLTGSLTSGKMINCENQGDVKGGNAIDDVDFFVAGLTAINEGDIINSNNNGNIEGGVTRNGFSCVGGLAGYLMSKGSIDNSKNLGTIVVGVSTSSNKSFTGLLVGRTNNNVPSNDGYNVYASCYNLNGNGEISGNVAQYLIGSCKATVISDLK